MPLIDLAFRRLMGRRTVTRLLDGGSSPTDFANLSITAMKKRAGLEKVKNKKVEKKLSITPAVHGCLLLHLSV